MKKSRYTEEQIALHLEGSYGVSERRGCSLLRFQWSPHR